MVRSLFDISLAAVCQHGLTSNAAFLPADSKEKLLEYFTSHDMLSSPECRSVFSEPSFSDNLDRINFFLSDQLTDEILTMIVGHSTQIHEINIIECPNVTDIGIINITKNQQKLFSLNLRAMRNLTQEGLKAVKSAVLHSVDLSGCVKLNSEAIFELVFFNPSIKKLSLNSCKGLDDQALYDIAYYIGKNLNCIELDFLPNMLEPATTIQKFSQRCPNISSLSLCRFFEVDENQLRSASDLDPGFFNEYEIEGVGLREIDLYGNHFAILPKLPPTLKICRLSLTGSENVDELVRRLRLQPSLRQLHLQLECLEEDFIVIENANQFLCNFLPLMGAYVTRLQITLHRMTDAAMEAVTEFIPELVDLALDVTHLNTHYLRRFFAGGRKSKGSRLHTLKLSRMRITYRALFAIGKNATSLTELECSYMNCIDDRFLILLADTCKQLRAVNFNGCKWVTDKGLSALARNGKLITCRVRGTACTDKSIYHLARSCPSFEWLSHRDFSGRPNFSEHALQYLRNSCIQRVIC
ncbi:hypothetical protein M3Y96_01132000 [Aphelenchoides besseyi]|nr:hypothetical protein M3Y96_01132000 [Aphelenchoides besseyi]